MPLDYPKTVLATGGPEVFLAEERTGRAKSMFGFGERIKWKKISWNNERRVGTLAAKMFGLTGHFTK